ncbi:MULTISPECIES: hypothetical protein [Nitrosomonas]|uniref:Uncharacterized protein n=1 Tax=Nitrosomonas communis TaxID=44574 RepID=A0A5D3YDF3_9PROT|nr:MULTISPECIES: hypothetical protein [Nitrosomonas]TYP81088.1 hypothetical protein BCL69_105425 [Nitrosomonas communis]UVS63112.1 hypothetical protein NX761_08480 [Nitrosomonas sp. PLL12]
MLNLLYWHVTFDGTKNVCRNEVARLEPVAYVFTLHNILGIFNYVKNRLLGFSSVALRGFPDLSGAARPSRSRQYLLREARIASALRHSLLLSALTPVHNITACGQLSIC